MRRERVVLAVAAVVLAGACSRLERLSVVRPTAERGGYTQVAPTYEVSDRGRKGAPESALRLLATAHGAYQAGETELAARQARQALRADPRLAEAHSLLGAIASGQGDLGAAGRHYQQALALAPQAGVHANNYGTWLCGSGRAAESLPWFDRALADPGYPTRAAAFANAGTCARLAGQPAAAEAAWRQALALEPGNLPALSGLALLAYERGAYLDARAFVERRLAAAPPDRETLILASQIETKLGDTVAASRYLHQLRTLSPGDSSDARAQ